MIHTRLIPHLSQYRVDGSKSNRPQMLHWTIGMILHVDTVILSVFVPCPRLCSGSADNEQLVLQRRHTVVTSCCISFFEKLSYSIRMQKSYSFRRQQCPSCWQTLGSSSLHQSEADSDVPNLFPDFGKSTDKLMMGVFLTKGIFNTNRLVVVWDLPPRFRMHCANWLRLQWLLICDSRLICHGNPVDFTASEAQARDVSIDLLQKEPHPVYI